MTKRKRYCVSRGNRWGPPKVHIRGLCRFAQDWMGYELVDEPPEGVQRCKLCFGRGR